MLTATTKVWATSLERSKDSSWKVQRTKDLISIHVLVLKLPRTSNHCKSSMIRAKLMLSTSSSNIAYLVLNQSYRLANNPQLKCSDSQTNLWTSCSKIQTVYRLTVEFYQLLSPDSLRNMKLTCMPLRWKSPNPDEISNLPRTRKLKLDIQSLVSRMAFRQPLLPSDELVFSHQLFMKCEQWRLISFRNFRAPKCGISSIYGHMLKHDKTLAARFDRALNQIQTGVKMISW